MRLNLIPIVIHAERLITAIAYKSWHYACNEAHDCLCAMPSPAWAEAEPGIASYGVGEFEAGQRVNQVRMHVMVWLGALIATNRTWEADDPWPRPINLVEAVARLREMCPQEATASAGES